VLSTLALFSLPLTHDSEDGITLNFEKLTLLLYLVTNLHWMPKEAFVDFFYCSGLRETGTQPFNPASISQAAAYRNDNRARFTTATVTTTATTTSTPSSSTPASEFAIPTSPARRRKRKAPTEGPDDDTLPESRSKTKIRKANTPPTSDKVPSDDERPLRDSGYSAESEGEESPGSPSKKKASRVLIRPQKKWTKAELDYLSTIVVKVRNNVLEEGEWMNNLFVFELAARSSSQVGNATRCQTPKPDDGLG